MFHLWRLFPRKLRRRVAQQWYEQLSRFDQDGEILFLNHGYADPDRQIDLAADDEPNRFPIQLYHQLAAEIDWSGCDALEVGCGRGGGAAYIARRFQPQSLVGLDITESAIAFCRRRHRLPQLSFERGDAQRLPFEDERFDVVLNVESSGSYADKPAFFREVVRVLKPSGAFLFADYRRRARVAKLRSQLAETGLTLVKERDISANVRLALELDDDRKRRQVERRVPRWLRPTFHRFAFVRTGANDEHAALSKGDKLYLSFVFRKPASGPVQAAAPHPHRYELPRAYA